MARTIAPPECMTVREIAEDLGCSVQTVYAYARHHGLPLRTKRGSERGFFAPRKEYRQWKAETYG